MSGANYEYCPGCDNKALYVGEDDVPENVETWHRECREKAQAATAAAERDRILARLEDLGEDIRSDIAAANADIRDGINSRRAAS